MEQKELIKLKGVVESVLFCNPDNGYTVLDLNTGGDYVTAVGLLGSVNEGEELVLSGSYVTHARFGVQFSATVCERILPSDAGAIMKYLSSGVIKGIGKTLAKRIVDEFSESALDVIEREPGLLVKVKGITPKKAEEIGIEFKRISGIRSLMIFLSQFEIMPSAAVGAWKRWGQYAIDIIRENPYILCENGIELEFGKAEVIAKKLEIPDDSESRIKAGIIYVLTENINNGHTCLPYDRLKNTVISLLGINNGKYEHTLETLIGDGSLYKYNKNNRDFVFLEEYFAAESYITGRLSVMNGCFKDTEFNYDNLIEVEEKTKDITYARQQRKAVSLALSQGFIILTGGPGTGKTTALKAIISLYEQRGMKVMIAAPTGKAAKRVSDLTGYDARTIHRLLEVVFDNNGKPQFRHNELEPVACDVMIVDEMSMVDTLLFESLLRALRLSCRLIMVGDSDQLPSVGAGNILKDMIDSGRLTVVHLTEIFRQAQKSCIITNAHKILNGNYPDMKRTDSDFFFIQRLDYNNARQTVVDLFLNRIPKSYGFSSADDIQILCPSRKGSLGVIEMNKALQEAVNPKAENGRSVKSLYYTFKENDKVMQIKNNYDILWSKSGEGGTGIYNGDIGTILTISRAENQIIIDFEGRICEYSFEMLDQLELAYAVTVHKSQGSEFNAVIIPLLPGYEKLYYRNLLYTAVTRAKKMLVIVGSQKAVFSMVDNNRRTLRYTCLRDMLEKELGT